MQKLIKNNKSRDIAGVIAAFILIVFGVIMAVVTINSFDQAVEKDQDSQLDSIVQSVDYNISEQLERFETQTERFVESDRMKAAIEEWEADGNDDRLKGMMQNSSVSNMTLFDTMVIMDGNRTAVSTMEGKDFAKGEELQENLFRFTDSIGNEYLAVRCDLKGSLECYSILDIKSLYYSTLRRINAGDDSIVLFEPATKMLFGEKKGEVQTCSAEDIDTAKGINRTEAEFILSCNESGAKATDSYDKKVRKDKLTTRIYAVPAKDTQNGIFAISASQEYDMIEGLVHSTVTRLLIYFAISAIGIVLALLVFLRGRREILQADMELEELKEKNRQMEALNQKTQELAHHQRLETIGTLTSSIAHEFNNLLTPIMGYSLMTLEKLPEEDETGVYDDVLEIYNASLKAKDIISRLSELSRKNTETKFQIISPDILVNKVIHVTAPALPKNVDIFRKLNCEDKHIEANETQISQLILNLIINAFQAMGEEGGEVTITTEKVGTDIMIEVADNGPGMSREIREKIFDPFFTTKESGAGTGLGLAIALQAAEDHNGRMEVESEEGEGSAFRVFIPEKELPAEPEGDYYEE